MNPEPIFEISRFPEMRKVFYDEESGVAHVTDRYVMVSQKADKTDYADSLNTDPKLQANVVNGGKLSEDDHLLHFFIDPELLLACLEAMDNDSEGVWRVDIYRGDSGSEREKAHAIFLSGTDCCGGVMGLRPLHEYEGKFFRPFAKPGTKTAPTLIKCCE